MFVNTDAHKFDSIEDNRRSNETMSSNLSHDFIIENNYITYTIESYLYSLILNYSRRQISYSDMKL